MRPCLAFPIALLVASIAIPLAAQDSKSLEYRAGDATPELRCSLLRHCTISFPPGVPLHDYIIADSARWVLDAGVAGPEDERLYWIAVKPRFCGIATLLTVPSSLELTHILLRSPECEREDALGPGDELRVLAPRLTGALDVPPLPPPRTPPVAAPPRPQPESLRFARPSRRLAREGLVVYHDGQRTYVQFPERPQVLPAVTRRGRRGRPEVALDQRWDGAVLVVGEVLERGVVLRDGRRIPFRFTD